MCLVPPYHIGLDVIIFIDSFTASCRWSSLRCRLIGSIDSSDSSPSVGVDFIVFRISNAAPVWADSRSFRCLTIYTKILQFQILNLQDYEILGWWVEILGWLWNTGLSRDYEILGWCPAGPVLPHGEKVPL